MCRKTARPRHVRLPFLPLSSESHPPQAFLVGRTANQTDTDFVDGVLGRRGVSLLNVQAKALGSFFVPVMIRSSGFCVWSKASTSASITASVSFLTARADEPTGAAVGNIMAPTPAQGAGPE
jgi:hypothetical protein